MLQRVRLSPQLHAGQILIYQLDFHASRDTTAASRVTSPQLPPSAELNTTCILQAEVVQATESGFRLRAYISEKKPLSQAPDSASAKPESVPDNKVELFVAWDGTASQITGRDQLSVAQQFAWDAWLARFSSALTYPKAGIHMGEKWVVTEPETAPSPLAKLVWLKKYQYIRNEPCGASPDSDATRSGSPISDTCAVILVQAQLHQVSAPSKSTPEDFKLRGLTTRGTASGSNETILYISRSTGLLVRSTEDAEQSMDATIALADGSNQVRYLMKAKSRSQVQLLSESFQTTR